MTQTITQATLTEFAAQLADHPIYSALQTVEDLQRFMEHPIYSVWGFMSLIKYLQHTIAPTTVPWLPRIPSPSRLLTTQTFEFLSSQQPHLQFWDKVFRIKSLNLMATICREPS